MAVPGSAQRLWLMRRLVSPTMLISGCLISRSITCRIEPPVLFSIGCTASSTSPCSSASNAMSNRSQGYSCRPGHATSAATSVYAPAQPWWATRRAGGAAWRTALTASAAVRNARVALAGSGPVAAAAVTTARCMPTSSVRNFVAPGVCPGAAARLARDRRGVGVRVRADAASTSPKVTVRSVAEQPLPRPADAAARRGTPAGGMVLIAWHAGSRRRACGAPAAQLRVVGCCSAYIPRCIAARSLDATLEPPSWPS
mmetsp:Transcript_30865/g.91830  ORF Transcript_30865/g.91830 Transcript_30865/m.91830 type:complete len:256 (-) Transcript_30865:183-950(-)